MCIVIAIPASFSKENKTIDSLTVQLEKSSKKAQLLNEIASEYMILNPQISLEYSNKALNEANKENSPKERADALYNIATAYIAFGEYDTSKIILSKAKTIYTELDDLNGQLKYESAIANIVFLSGNYDQAMEMYEKNLKTSELLNYDEIKTISWANIGRIYWLKGDYAMALSSYDTALAVANKIKSDYSIAMVNLLIGLVYQAKGYYEIATEYLHTSQSHYEKINCTAKLPYVYHYLGVVFFELGEYDTSYEYLKRASEGMENNNDNWGKGLVYRYLGKIHNTWSNYDSSYFYISKSLEIAKNMNDRTGEMYSLRFLGELYSDKGEIDSAIKIFNQSLKIANESGNTQERVNILYDMGVLFSSQKDYALAMQYFEQSKKLADSLNMLYESMINCKVMAEIYESKANYYSALVYFKQYKLLNDSLFTEKKRKNIAEMQLKYETVKKNNQINQLKVDKVKQQSQIKQQRLLNYSFAGGILFISIIIIILIYYYNQKKKINKALYHQKEELQFTLENLNKAQEKLIETKKMAALGSLVAGVAHEINTPVGITITAASSLLEETHKMAELYKTNKISRSDFRGFIDNANNAVKLIMSNMDKTATLVQSFKQISVDQTLESKRPFNFKEYTEDIIRSLYPKLKTRKISITLEIDSKLEITSYPGAFSQIITNLVINSLTHGFEEEQIGKIDVITNRKDGELVLKYKDNGSGISEINLQKIYDPFFTTNKKSGTGLGMHIVYNLVTQKLKGTIKCESKEGKGVLFLIKLPL